MRKLLVIFLASLVLGGCNLKSMFTQPPAGLEIATVPAAAITLNGESSGNTPFSNQELKAGSYLVKLSPSDSSFPAFETKLELGAGTTTVLSHTFASSEVDSAGYTLQLVETTPDTTQLSVISNPDMVNINLDGSPSGFTPLSKLAVTPGDHSLVISSPGFTTQELVVTARKGYNLIVNVKLAGSVITLEAPVATSSAQPSPSPSSTPTALASTSPSPSTSPTTSQMSKPYVLVGETETGWLRIRQEPSGSSAELGKADEGEKLKYLEVTTDTGWHKVEFEKQVGYVSAKYVTLVK